MKKWKLSWQNVVSCCRLIENFGPVPLEVINEVNPWAITSLHRTGIVSFGFSPVRNFVVMWSCGRWPCYIYNIYIYIWCSLKTTSSRRSVLYICIRNLYSAARRKLKCKTDDFSRNIAVLNHTARLHHDKNNDTFCGLADTRSIRHHVSCHFGEKHIHRPMCVPVRFVVRNYQVLVPVQLLNCVLARESGRSYR